MQLVSLPLSFEPNRGQADPAVHFIARGPGYTALLEGSGITFDLMSPRAERGPFRVARNATVSRNGLRFIGAKRHPLILGLDPLPGKVNYLIGRDPRGWRTDIPTYARVVERDVYPGIDLVWHGKAGWLEYDWVVHPGAHPGAVGVAVDGEGRLSRGRKGSLVLHTPAGDLIQQPPLAYQQVDGRRRAVRAAYVLGGDGEIHLHAAPYDRSRSLVVDPVIGSSTFLGGSQGDVGQRLTVDGSGNIYVTGTTSSPNFPVHDPYQRYPGDPTGLGAPHAFVSKMNARGNQLLFSTYLGGSGFDEGFGVAVDATGVFVTGDTGSSDFPTVHAFQSTYGGGGSDAFIAKLSPAGDSLLFSSYLGGKLDDAAFALASDGAGNAYLAGDSVPLNAGGANGPFNGSHALVAKVSGDGTLLYRILLAGSVEDTGYAIAADAAGDAYVAGSTRSPDFPSEKTPPAGLIGPTDAYVAKLDPSGKLIFSRHVGGNGATVANAVAVGGSGDIYLAGQTDATDLPTAGGFERRYGGNTAAVVSGDGFLAKLDSSGTLQFGTYLGGHRDEEVRALAEDGANNAYVTGWTDSADFPVKNAIQPAFIGASCSSSAGSYPCTDAFAASVSPSGALRWSTFLGGSGSDKGDGIAVGTSGDVYLTGITDSPDLETVGALPGGAKDPANASIHAYVMRLLPGAAVNDRSVVIDRVLLYHEVAGHMVRTSSIRRRERVTVVALYHSSRGGSAQALGTLILQKHGREVLQRVMEPGKRGGRDDLSATFTVTSKKDEGTLAVRVAVIEGRAVGFKTLRFRATL